MTTSERFWRWWYTAGRCWAGRVWQLVQLAIVVVFIALVIHSCGSNYASQ